MAPPTINRARRHVRANALTWYVAMIVTLIFALQLGLGDRLHGLFWGG